MTYDYTIKILDRQIKHLHKKATYHRLKNDKPMYDTTLTRILELENVIQKIKA